MAPRSITTSPAPPAPASVAGPSDPSIQSLVDLVNSHRASRGLHPLAWDERVAAVAQAHSQDMVDRGFYGHVNPDGEGPDERLTEAGIAYTAWGENYCYGFSSASSAFNFWINSGAHRANIENGNFTHHGVGKVGSVWTHVFLRPPNVTGVELSVTRPRPDGR
ncbi:MAG TPA: CAP domain-containing protein [Candidatus Eisenbacteria bacterium]|nr:CAP domain-containing protein [Candidatus Eisenbacteria bacterium]